MRKIIFPIIFIFVLIAGPVFARPVSYVGGWTSIQEIADERFSNLIHYTFHRHFALGYRYAYSLDKEWHYHGPQLNILGKRWNNENSQANIFLHAGLGQVYSNKKNVSSNNELGMISGFSADWEDRRYFTSYAAHYMNLGDIDEFFEQKARVGIAPYVAESGALHTWLMVEMKHEPKADREWSVTPLVRFFKGPVMTELGYTIDGEVMANLKILF